jgi:hypothetical protein
MLAQHRGYTRPRKSNQRGDRGARLPASASQTLYSSREAEVGSTSNCVIGEPSNNEMLLTYTAKSAAVLAVAA